ASRARSSTASFRSRRPATTQPSRSWCTEGRQRSSPCSAWFSFVITPLGLRAALLCSRPLANKKFEPWALGKRAECTRLVAKLAVRLAKLAHALLNLWHHSLRAWA